MHPMLIPMSVGMQFDEECWLSPNFPHQGSISQRTLSPSQDESTAVLLHFRPPDHLTRCSQASDSKQAQHAQPLACESVMDLQARSCLTHTPQRWSQCSCRKDTMWFPQGRDKMARPTPTTPQP